ncbi:hypothetical protein FJ937_17375 [Mesorhizobium sp. B2-4-4]|uniref:hypothetical protein n=1 Tax=Mesorhizobium sp. B2-4-4 TaxID=2589945 RepID=UPI00112B49C9|nr:hypothetical protein [Mesorhizobium sp. B2-4-4]TPL49249.1 hypothetical protein FJ937_17375 [Mesorhizobium sp. B2-4-4]
MPTIGFVIEGSHDLVMLPPLIKGELSARGYTDVRFQVIHPRADETGRIEGGGWKRVKAWCSANGGKNLQSFFQPLFADHPALDAIVLHLDGDSLLDVCRSSSVQSPSLPVSVNARVSHIVEALAEWLDASQSYEKKLVFAVPVQSTEAWILASEATYHDIEAMDAKEEFQRTFSREKHGTMEDFYRHRSAPAETRVAQIAAQSSSYARFRDALCEALAPVQTDCQPATNPSHAG